ncbi:type 1 fimbrial protein [Salmonella enterica]|nr:type 1 fimbrial protein [Salmonella enterica]EEL2514001.1 type 1 fimbrial protein [Salmonella enterica]EGK0773788.1 type 1 fimbrial protein [Salmonella enterica]EJF0848263.1 type 1 fimbrial protein [Salmonella enterica]EKM8003693.1 type 1 fimbrial protein [Salmonella enterica]
MKKSMAGQGVAGALLLTGLMVSAGAMAASGDPVTGGSGTVTINVPIVTSTCSVSVPTEVNFDSINKNSLPSGSFIASKNFDTVFSNCKDKTLQMSVQASSILPDGMRKYGYFDSGDPDHIFYYDIQPPQDAEITGGDAYIGSTRVFALDNARPVLIKPGSDNYTMSSKVDLSHNSGNMANVGSAVSASFTYNITYQ